MPQKRNRSYNVVASTPHKQRKTLLMTPKEFSATYVRKRILHWKSLKYSQSMTLKQLKDVDGVTCSISTVKNNWNKTEK